MDVLQTINRYKHQNLKRSKHAFFFGFSRWKHHMVKPFLTEISSSKFHFINPFFGQSAYTLAQKRGLDKNCAIYIWGRRSFPEVENYAKLHALEVFRIEDGFVRSNALGSDLTQPYSLVVDSRGIYFDPTEASDLEHILQNTDFQKSAGLLERAQNVAKYLVDKKLSKYNVYEHKLFQFPEDKSVILVPGQVEDDASIQYGANGATNLSLLKAVRQNCPDDWIVFKPHPDVLVGNRTGHVVPSDALRFCDQIITEASIDSVLSRTSEVHTLTSLVGFEALMRGKKVVTYGQPFYAGWGLTVDQVVNSKRTRNLTLHELVAGTLLLYPRYINPLTHQPCEIELVFEGLEFQQARLQNSRILRAWKAIRNRVVRIFQFKF
ncbi:MAG: capsule biosynthesis protein [Thiotrichales bacterium]|nr:capsule biosynthesis protein [Thiotrichales bacterium]